MLIAFNKPFGVLSQFTQEIPGQRTLAEFGFPAAVYSLGRLDADTEGLLLLSDEAELNQLLLRPQQGHWRRYWAQVEGLPTAEELEPLRRGLLVNGRQTLPGKAWLLSPQPKLPPRTPPIRVRKNVPDCWIALELVEGKNRQVRRMTASAGFPTLRLIRVQIGQFELASIPAGQWRVLSPAERKMVFSSSGV
jgi:23S rRNA pseudouridine2457 synthase